MALISLGAFTPSLNPGSMTIIQKDKPTAVMQTYSGAAYFAWPATIVGKVLDLSWNLIPVADWTALDALYAADAVVVFDPNDGSSKTYNVNILSLAGTYYIRNQSRSDVKLSLLVMSEVP